MSAMQEFVTSETIATSVRMVRKAQKKSKPILLVEGGTDVRLYKWIVRDRADVIPGTGKDNVLGASSLLNDCWDWCIFILDADFDRLLALQRDERIILTDLHDIEGEYFRSDAFMKTLEEFCSFSKLRSAFPSISSSELFCTMNEVRKAVIEACRVIGCLRLVSIKHNLGLRFKGLDHKKVLKTKSIEIDKAQLIRVVLANGANSSTTEHQVNELLMAEMATGHDDWQLCQGHDLVSVACIGIRRVWGDGKVNEAYLERALRLAYEAEFFWDTLLGNTLNQKLQSGCSL